MTSRAIRQSFLQFFQERGHTVVPSSPVIPYDDPTLLFTNAGMNQFKDVFLGTGRRPYVRAVNTQKCIRVSGKHNDLEEVGRDTYHHTFFEMLGNWSFGDYYKKEAIAWAWELLTEVWKLPKHRLWATVYEDDDEAEQLWKTVTDIRHDHVLRFGEKDNFWEMGETGPCGPCSEIHFDRTPEGNATAELVNAGRPELIEIWNLVFIQYDRDATGRLTPLPAKHVDTGMGFERICAVLQNKSSNYDTDIFTPLLDTISTITGQTYTGSLTSETDIAFRVVADHVRALTFAIADGALPSNEGRGYVLRRILRRAARFGRSLKMHEPFIYKLVPTLVDTMGDVFPEISEKQDHIQKVIKGEEEGFNATLDRGLEIFDDVVRKAQSAGRTVITGEEAFKLYDTYGFPLDLTQLLARERGLSVDEEGFQRLMEEQRERSRGVISVGTEEFAGTSRELVRSFDVSNFEQRFTFVGYDELETESPILLARDRFVILERTPFYGESGGQVGDTGIIELNGERVRVLDTQKSGNVHIHIVQGRVPQVERVRARVDRERRLAIMRNHTATHLVHAALRKILGTHVHQAGSLVAPDYLRFDFAHFSRVSESELADIEALVNEKIAENIPLTHYRNIPFEEAKKMGALMFFGEKYGARVNVVEFGDFSREFCGGTHVRSTAEIGYFKLRTEGSVASGVRRIEAVTHDAALELLRIQTHSLHDRIDYAFQKLEELSALQAELSRLGGGTPPHAASELSSFEKALNELKRASKGPASLRDQFADVASRARSVEDIILKLADIKRVLEKELSKYRLRGATAKLEELIRSATRLNGIRLVAAKVEATSMDELKSLGDTLRAKIGSGVGLLAAVVEDKVALVCVVTDDLVSSGKLNAGQVIGSVAKLLGGGGGGRPHMATAGGRDVGKLDEALKQTETIVKSFLHNKGGH